MFLQPWLLLALPLVALPVIIHLINRQRFQSVPWAAMMFLLSAQALSRGYSKLRAWLVMLARMAAVAAAVLAVSRPLSQGWMAVAGGGRQATAIVLLDRSPSMSQAAVAGGESKLTTARRQVALALETLGTERVVLIDSVSAQPIEVSSPRGLLEVPEGDPAAAAADLPLMLQAACEELTANRSAASTIWICSDQRANDWKVTDGAWPAIREAIGVIPQSVRLTLLASSDSAADNLAVRVTGVALHPRETGFELRLEIAIRRESDTGPASVPVLIELGPARSTVMVDLTGTEALLAGHTIPIDISALQALSGDAGLPAASNADPALALGWGRVSIPADTNPADNDFYFAFGLPPLRRVIVVAEESQTQRTLELVAGITPERLLRGTVETVAAEAVVGLPLEEVSLILWQGALPESGAAEALTGFVARGGQVIFLPPKDPTPAAFAGISWGAWSAHSPPLRPASWRADEGLLASTTSGTALPVGELEIGRTCAILGEATALAVLADGSPVLTRAASDHGGVYFLATTPQLRDSDLAANGVVLYAIVQRAIDAGLEVVAGARLVDAGGGVAAARQVRGPQPEPAALSWLQVAGPPATSSEAGFHEGMFASAGRLLAVNRPAAEDGARVVADEDVDALFAGLSWSRFQNRAGAVKGVVEEVWRLFLVAVLLALIAEGLLCLPALRPPAIGPKIGKVIA